MASPQFAAPQHQSFHEMSLSEQNKDIQRRRHGRVLCRDVECSLGTLLDLSASGMRVRTSGKPPAIGSLFATTLEGLDGPMLVGGVIMWTKRAGFLKFEVGIEFREVTPAMKQTLTRLARSSSQNETIHVRP